MFQACSSHISAAMPRDLTITQRYTYFRDDLYGTRKGDVELAVTGLVRPVSLALKARRTLFPERLQTFQPVFGRDHLGDNSRIRGALKLCVSRDKYSDLG